MSYRNSYVNDQPGLEVRPRSYEQPGLEHYHHQGLELVSHLSGKAGGGHYPPPSSHSDLSSSYPEKLEPITSSVPIPLYYAEDQQQKSKVICGLRPKVFWILTAVVATIILVCFGVGLGVGISTGRKNSSDTLTQTSTTQVLTVQTSTSANDAAALTSSDSRATSATTTRGETTTSSDSRVTLAAGGSTTTATVTAIQTTSPTETAQKVTVTQTEIATTASPQDTPTSTLVVVTPTAASSSPAWIFEMCADYNFESCTYVNPTLGVCYKVPSDLVGAISSVRTTSPYECNIFQSDDCSGDVGGPVTDSVSLAELGTGGSAGWDNKVASYKCQTGG